jgi:hypothetical protein
LRRIFRNQPAIIVDGNEDADIHRGTAPINGRTIRPFKRDGEAMRVPSFKRQRYQVETPRHIPCVTIP